jgi:hypothetical protein
MVANRPWSRWPDNLAARLPALQALSPSLNPTELADHNRSRAIGGVSGIFGLGQDLAMTTGLGDGDVFRVKSHDDGCTPAGLGPVTPEPVFRSGSPGCQAQGEVRLGDHGSRRRSI